MRNFKIAVAACWVGVVVFSLGCDLLSSKSPYDLAKSGKIDILKKLLDDGLDVNQTYGYQKQTILFGAVEREDEATAKFLIERGARVDFKDKNGNTPLIHSLYRGYEKPVKLLLDNGARVNEKNNRGRTPFHIAVIRDRTRLAEILVQHGAEIEFRDKQGNGPLHRAVKNGNLKLVQLLLGHEIKVNVKNNAGFTPLYYAEEYSFRKISKLLRSNKARLANPPPTEAFYKRTYRKILGKGPLRVQRVIKHGGSGGRIEYSTQGDQVAQVLFPDKKSEENPDSMKFVVQMWNVHRDTRKFSRIKTPGPVLGMRFVSDGNLLITSSQKPGIAVWDPRAGKKLREIGIGEGAILDTRPVGSSRHLLVGENKRAFYRQELSILDAFYPVFKEMTGGLEHSVWVYDYDTGRAVREYRGHMNTVWEAGFSADGQYVASSTSGNYSDYGGLRIWETATGRPVRISKNLGWVNHISVFPEGHRLAATDGGRTLILDMASGIVIRNIREGGDLMELLQGGRFLIFIKNHQLLLVNVKTGRVVQKANFKKHFHRLGNHYDDHEYWTELKVSPRGDSFVAATNHGKIIFFKIKDI